MVAVGSGLSAQAVAKDETTYGVAPSLVSGVDSFEMKSETLELKKTAVQGQSLAAGALYNRTKRRVVTEYKVDGGVNMELPTRNMAFWLRHMLGSFGQSNANLTQVGVTGIYKSVHQPGTVAGHSFTFQKGVPAVDATIEPFTYVGCKIASWEIAIGTGAIGALTLTLVGRNELAGASTNGDSLNASVPPLATFATPTTGLGESVFHFRQATVLTGGTPTLTSGVVSLTGATAAGNVTDAKVHHALSFDDKRFFLGGNGFMSEPIEENFRAISGSITVEWLSSEAIYNAYAADSTTSLQLTFTGPSVSTSNYLLDIIIPNIKFQGESPKVSGPKVVTQTANFVGLDDEATTPIQITYQSEDSTP